MDLQFMETAIWDLSLNRSKRDKADPYPVRLLRNGAPATDSSSTQGRFWPCMGLWEGYNSGPRGQNWADKDCMCLVQGSGIRGPFEGSLPTNLPAVS